MSDEHIYEKCKLFFRWLKDCTYTVYHGSNDDPEGFTKGDICQLIREEEKDFSQSTIILAPPLFHRNHEISGKDDSNMGCQRIIREAAAIPLTNSETGWGYAVDFKMVVHIFRIYYRHFNKAPPEKMYADMECYRHMIKDGRHSIRLLKPKSAVYFTYRVA